MRNKEIIERCFKNHKEEDSEINSKIPYGSLSRELFYNNPSSLGLNNEVMLL